MKSRAEIENELVAFVSNALESSIEALGKASLLVSGGSTPKQFFERLSHAEINWSKVDVGLVDERLVPDDHPDQNGGMVKELLLQNNAASANFIPLIFDANNSLSNLKLARISVTQLLQPFTVVLLGMGTDGHTASLFPDSPDLEEAMKLDQPHDLMTVNTASSPYERITFTRKALLNTNNLILHFYGKEKEEILEKARYEEAYKPFPIQAFIYQDQVKINVFWTN